MVGSFLAVSGEEMSKAKYRFGHELEAQSKSEAASERPAGVP